MFLLTWLMETAQAVVLDVIAYLVVDGFVKIYLQDLHDDGEKQQVWLWECIALSVISLVIYSVSHTPCLLLTVLALTLIYTQLRNQVNFPQLLANILNKWEEFQQHELHEQSMEKIQAASTAHTQLLQAQLMQSQGNIMPPGWAGMYNRMPDNSLSPGGSGQLPVRPMMPGYMQPKVAPLLARPSIKRPSSVKARIISSFGYNPYAEHPPGLENTGQLCFMNAIMQCLARAPAVVQSLLQPDLAVSSQSRSLIDGLGKMLEELALPPGQLEEHYLKTRQLRTSLSGLVNSPIAAENERQTQQDVAEFFLWLLNSMHDIIKQPVSRDIPGELALPRQPTSPIHTAVTLNIINMTYQKLNIKNIKELKKNTLAEIESGHMVEGYCYSESMKRLADFEWLLYKHSNNSTLDDLFCGQLVEAQQCTSCDRIRVHVQPFQLLSMSMCKPRTVDGLVYLYDCFAHLTSSEVLNGDNGIKCDCMNHDVSVDHHHSSLLYSPMQSNSISPITANGFATSTLNNQLRRRLLNSSASNMSPVVSMEGGSTNRLLDNDDNIKTSTPIRNFASSIARLTEGRRQTLLRQLPECLTIHLIRFIIRNGCLAKNKQPLVFPLCNLDLTEIVEGGDLQRDSLPNVNTSMKYALYAFCVHLGGDSASNGHYIAYAHIGCGAWYKFDDEKVTPVNIEYVLSTREVRENAYLLFYRKFNA